MYRLSVSNPMTSIPKIEECSRLRRSCGGDPRDRQSNGMESIEFIGHMKSPFIRINEYISILVRIRIFIDGTKFKRYPWYGNYKHLKDIRIDES